MLLLTTCNVRKETKGLPVSFEASLLSNYCRITIMSKIIKGKDSKLQET